MVLIGMSNMEQVQDNISYMKEFKDFSKEEFDMTDRAREMLKSQDNISCTTCRYCIDECPKSISIPDLFACYNAKKQYKDWNSEWYYGVYTNGKGKAAECIKCGKCEAVCPQHLTIRDYLGDVSQIFDRT